MGIRPARTLQFKGLFFGLKIMKKLVYGKCINDYSGTVSEMADGKKKNKPFYNAWMNMLQRCYSDKYHQRYPTYIGCLVCESWLSLATFKAWYDDNHIDGYHLDKDIIKRGNKIYCPKYCRYIPHSLNTLLNDRAASRGRYPIGVCFYAGRKTKPYKAQVNTNEKRTYLGMFPTIKEAFMAYANYKAMMIIDVAREQEDMALKDGLVSYAEHLLDQADAY